MSAAEYYNVGPDYHQQNPAPAPQQAYPPQTYPQYPQPVRLPAAPRDTPALGKTLTRGHFSIRGEEGVL